MTRGGGSVGGGGGRGGRVSEAQLYVVMVDDESKVTLITGDALRFRNPSKYSVEAHLKNII